MKPRTAGSLGIYYDRWRALDQLIAESAEYYRLGPAFDRRDTILLLLRSLQDFAAGQFQFFYYGHDPVAPQRSPQDALLHSWDEYPAEDILTGILGQIGHDLELIRRAADQRLQGLHSPHMLAALQNADLLAWNALRPAVQAKVVETDTTVLTYFEKSAEFFRIPYAAVALIAIPFTCTADNNPSDYLAIPHEAGHYVYRRLQGPARAELRKLLAAAQISDDYHDWLSAVFEEVCADIYGCLVGGPVMALDFQSLSLESSETDFRVSDGDHPNAAIRPFIYCQVLSSDTARMLTQDDWRPLAGDLSRRWNQILLQRHVTAYVIQTRQTDGEKQTTDSKPYNLAATYYANNPNNATPDYGPLGNVLHGVVEALISMFLKYANLNSLVKVPGWAGPILSTTQSGDLFSMYDANFAEFVKDLKANQGLPLEKDLSATVTQAWAPTDHSDLAPKWRAWLTQTNAGLNDDQVSKFIGDWLGSAKVAAGGWPAGEQIPSGEVKDPNNMAPGTWGYILRADGWAIGGPSGSENGHPL